ncbi:uncharacterized protein LOC120352101 [Nilaparvata lugens]|uniref:uncharacterized protein LOC111048496 n=1 Tax=Nilaparvata lugens TaxID=108931 RepID=UPI00193EC0B8|nr:uncharacterized protein LOC111048496 [Nilaparvata lugens]XP_039287724.1 uncharacterized protein LOC120352101 [Nilaparvata lugens]
MKIVKDTLKLLIITFIIFIGRANGDVESIAKKFEFDSDEYDSSNVKDDMANYYISSDFFKNNMNTKYLKDTINSLIKAQEDKQIKSNEAADAMGTGTHNPVEMLKSLLEGFMVVANNPTENKSSTTMNLPNPFTVSMEPLFVPTSLTNKQTHQPTAIAEQSSIKIGKNKSLEEVSNKQSSLDIYKPVFVALAEHCDQMKMTIEELKIKQQNIKKENQDLNKKLDTLQTNFMEKLRSQNEITGRKLDSIRNQQNDEKNYILKVAATLINIEDRLLKENELSLKEIELENILTKTELLQHRINGSTGHSKVRTESTERSHVKEYENILQNLILEQDLTTVSQSKPTIHILPMFTKPTNTVTHKPTEVFKSDIAKMISQIVHVHKNSSQEKATEEGIDKTTDQYEQF